MIWHNEEAGQLAQQIQKILKAWNGGAICPNEFLHQLEDVVRDARRDKEASRINASPKSSS